MTFEMILVLGFGGLVFIAFFINAIVARKKRAPQTHYDVRNGPTYDVEGHQKFSKELRDEIDQRADRDSRPWH